MSVRSLYLSGRADVQRSLLARADVSLQRQASAFMSITSNIVFFRGEDLTINFQMTPPTDVTGWNITLTVKDTLGGTTQFTKTATIVDGPRGQWKVVIANADTASLAVGRYVWDARRTDSGNKATLADGYIDLRQEITT
jgi:hypothetical protein